MTDKTIESIEGVSEILNALAGKEIIILGNSSDEDNSLVGFSTGLSVAREDTVRFPRGYYHQVNSKNDYLI